VLAGAEREGQEVLFRTLVHPTVGPLRRHAGSGDSGRLTTCMTIRELGEAVSADHRAGLRGGGQRAGDLCCAGASADRRADGTVAVEAGAGAGLNTRIVGGLSFLEPVCAALELDPFTRGVQIIDATELAGLSPEEVGGRIIPTMPLLVVQVVQPAGGQRFKIALGEGYPDEWPVRLVRAAGVDSDEAVIEMPLYELDRNSLANHLCTLYVPPRGEMEVLSCPSPALYHHEVEEGARRLSLGSRADARQSGEICPGRGIRGG